VFVVGPHDHVATPLNKLFVDDLPQRLSGVRSFRTRRWLRRCATKAVMLVVLNIKLVEVFWQRWPLAA